jgi:hypothetical protein
MKSIYLNTGSMFFFGTEGGDCFRSKKIELRSHKKTASNSLLEIFEDRFRSFLQIMLKKTANNYILTILY